MLKFLKGDLFEQVSNVDGIINTVNTVGVMGKGIALEFKKRYPNNFKIYKEACKNKHLDIGKILTVKNEDNDFPKYIINFPTKKHWRYPSKIEYIEKGLDALKEEIKKNSINSIAMPALGCGNGGLNWAEVKSIIISKLNELEDVQFYIYEPNMNTKKKENIKLNTFRALLLLVIDQYNSSEFNRRATYIEVNYLAFILQSMGAQLNLTFKETGNGPIAESINKLLIALKESEYLLINRDKDISYISVNKRKFNKNSKFLKDNEVVSFFNDTKELLIGFETEERLKALTLSLWFYQQSKQLNEEYLINKLKKWQEKNKIKFADSLLLEAVSRVISVKSPPPENLSFDL
ncbi:macro domain-containing protein [Caldifermentibacillus hisashii]|uniref:type II toxin-antitoxin system antitoxin DNA ADP-ribosyl glycohydrolase DarG n=1 Tax=Caldifermentibacillus hisashii TaxID=996558 RepID=UPI0031350BBE